MPFLRSITYVLCLLLCLLTFSCKDRQKANEQIAVSIIHQNFAVLMDSISYFDSSKIPESTVKKDDIVVNLYAKAGTMDLEESIHFFKEKYSLKQEKFEPLYFDIENIPVSSADHYPVHLVQSIPTSGNTVNVSLVNCLIDTSGKFASVTVIKSRGGGARFEIYFFKEWKGQWKSDGKKLLAVG